MCMHVCTTVCAVCCVCVGMFVYVCACVWMCVMSEWPHLHPPPPSWVHLHLAGAS